MNWLVSLGNAEQALIVSVLSMFLSVLAIVFTYLEYRRDRPSLKVTAYFHPETGQGPEFEVYLVNVGRRPIRIPKVALRLKSGGELLPLDWDYGTKLGEQDSCSCRFPLWEYRAELGSPLDVEQAEVYDLDQQKHTFQFRRLKKQIVREWTPVDWLDHQSVG